MKVPSTRPTLVRANQSRTARFDCFSPQTGCSAQLGRQESDQPERQEASEMFQCVQNPSPQPHLTSSITRPPGVQLAPRTLPPRRSLPPPLFCRSLPLLITRGPSKLRSFEASFPIEALLKTRCNGSERRAVLTKSAMVTENCHHCFKLV